MVAGAAGTPAFPVVSADCGPFRVHALVMQTFGMDAGALHGIIPRPLWEPVAGPPDGANRFPLGAVVVIVEAGHRRILLDGGLGWKLEPKFASIHNAVSLAPDWETLLAPIGLTPAGITDVFLTHLHFDHCGGFTTGDPEAPLAFPDAIHHVQKSQWGWAHQPTVRDRASYLPANLQPLGQTDRLVIHQDAAAATAALRQGLPDAVARELEVRVSDGHTPGHQMLLLRGALRGEGVPEAQGLLTGVDLIPARQFLKPAWVYAFDHFPLTTVAEKEVMLREAVEGHWLVLYGHEGGRWPAGDWCVGQTVKDGPKGIEAQATWMVPAPELAGSNGQA